MIREMGIEGIDFMAQLLLCLGRSFAAQPAGTVDAGTRGPACSGDGNFVFFANGEQPQRIGKVPIMGGTPQYLSDILGDQATGGLAISPDGKLLAYPYTQYGRVPSQGWRVAVMSVDGGPPLKQFNVPGGMLGVRRSPSGKGFEYVMTQTGAANLWE